MPDCNTSAEITYLGIHVCSIQVNLASVFVNQLTHIPNLLLKHTIGGRVRDHDGCQVLFVFVHLEARRETKEKVISVRLIRLLQDKTFKKACN